MIWIDCAYIYLALSGKYFFSYSSIIFYCMLGFDGWLSSLYSFFIFELFSNMSFSFFELPDLLGEENSNV